jgi:hypothetical protein
MDCVYICRAGDNEELRYSLRSVNENYPCENIWVVGGRPSWYSGNYLRMPASSSKYQNARMNLKALIQYKGISDNFVLMNDDFYVLEKIEKPEQYHGGPLAKKVEEYVKVHPHSQYTRLLFNTLKGIRRRYGIQDPLDYELHLPMEMHKEGLTEAMQTGFLWRSVFGNVYGVGGTYTEDVKVYRKNAVPEELREYASFKVPYLSTSDKSFQAVHSELLEQKFSTPSPFEDGIRKKR